MYNMPFPGFPYYKNYYLKNYNYQKKENAEIPKYEPDNDNSQENIKNGTTSNVSSSTINKNQNSNKRIFQDDNQAYINILGINLYSDDILILCILLSLYIEGIKDEMLFICLILILLS